MSRRIQSANYAKITFIHQPFSWGRHLEGTIVLHVHASDITHGRFCASRSARRNSLVMRKRGNSSKNPLSCHLMVTLTSHWQPLHFDLYKLKSIHFLDGSEPKNLLLASIRWTIKSMFGINVHQNAVFCFCFVFFFLVVFLSSKC